MLRLALLFMLATSSAWADWVAIGKSPDFIMYVDPQSMRRSGNIASAWIMGDYAKTQKNASHRLFLGWTLIPSKS